MAGRGAQSPWRAEICGWEPGPPGSRGQRRAQEKGQEERWGAQAWALEVPVRLMGSVLCGRTGGT